MLISNRDHYQKLAYINSRESSLPLRLLIHWTTIIANLWLGRTHADWAGHPIFYASFHGRFKVDGYSLVSPWLCSWVIWPARWQQCSRMETSHCVLILSMWTGECVGSRVERDNGMEAEETSPVSRPTSAAPIHHSGTPQSPLHCGNSRDSGAAKWVIGSTGSIFSLYIFIWSIL